MLQSGLRLGFVIILCVVLSNLIPARSSLAQDNKIRIPAVAPTFMQWSQDSRNLVFREQEANQEFAIYFDSPNWQIFDVQSRTLSSVKGYPLAPKLTPREARVFVPYPPDGTLNDTHVKFISASPDGRYLVYGGTKRTFTALYEEGSEKKWVWKLRIGDRKTLEWVETTVDMYQPADLGLSGVWWSLNGHTFVLDEIASVDVMTDPFYFTFVTGYANDLTRYYQQKEFRLSTFKNKPYRTERIYALSGDGRYVLMQAYEKLDSFSNDHPQDRLLIYDAKVRMPVSEITGIDLETVQYARFLPNDSNRILMTCGLGMIIYNVSAQNWIVVNDSLNTRDFPFIEFSPNFERLWMLDSSGRLYVLRTEYIDLIGALKPFITPSSSATRTPS